MAISELSFNQIKNVSGADAAATRLPGQNSWGQWNDPEAEISYRCSQGQWLYCIYFALDH
ncbi:hypothetical protein Undi14_04635 [Undibacterium sp. 14-3-2]|uniref:hypothetical protein n=1 Tax=Undibacterium sp. 14-3-2 TaxID=2800129 RepID=UPI001908E2C7|nr:hypothetical protein [Undibacterium sp. 14-3-2]MBK1889309.1 hypothetical protein [Undibacterium sp. 14-3-2]